MKLLIPGGAGYIGSHMVRLAQDEGYDVVVLDDFSTGHKSAIKDCEILEVNLLNNEKLEKLLKGRYFDGVIHFAAKSLVGESIKNPNLYYRNNFVGSANLINALIKNDINNIVFSSTAAIFGRPNYKKISEDHQKAPINPYGRSKLMVETMLEDICSVHDFNAVSLRYFNAAGAHESAEIGEQHEPETHLIPKILKSIISNEKIVTVYGNDYSTPDGTCIRDYIHVMDLVNSHILALNYLQNTKGFSAFNLGNGNGFSVFEIIKGCEKVADTKISYEIGSRRSGDPAVLVADNNLALRSLKWNPKITNIEDIIKSAWLWHKRTN